MDIGVLIGAPLIGSILHFAPQAGLAGYPTMFIALSVVLACAGIYYAVNVVRAVDSADKKVPRSKDSLSETQVEPEPASCAS
jgi:hypothetical protein